MRHLAVLRSDQRVADVLDDVGSLPLGSRSSSACSQGGWFGGVRAPGSACELAVVDPASIRLRFVSCGARPLVHDRLSPLSHAPSRVKACAKRHREPAGSVLLGGVMLSPLLCRLERTIEYGMKRHRNLSPLSGSLVTRSAGCSLSLRRSVSARARLPTCDALECYMRSLADRWLAHGLTGSESLAEELAIRSRYSPHRRRYEQRSRLPQHQCRSTRSPRCSSARGAGRPLLVAPTLLARWRRRLRAI